MSTTPSQSVVNKQTIARLIMQTIIAFVGVATIFTGAFWYNIQLKLLPPAIVKCLTDEPTEAIHPVAVAKQTKCFAQFKHEVAGKAADTPIILFVVGIFLVILGFTESVIGIVRAIKNGKK